MDTFQLLFSFLEPELRIRFKYARCKTEEAGQVFLQPHAPPVASGRRLLSGHEALNVTHSDTALAPQSNTFPAKRPLTRANCLSFQFSCSRAFTAFR